MIKTYIKRKQKTTTSKISDIIERQQEIRTEIGLYHEDSSEYILLELKKTWLFIVLRFWHIWIV